MINLQIKSFVLRQGKITTSQKEAIKNLMPKFGIKYQDCIIDFTKIFINTQPLIIEIGFGMGDATWQIAKDNPQNNYVGIEVHSPGVGALLMKLRDSHDDINNLKIIQHDAINVLKNMVTDNSIQGFHLYFPDPWPKKRHHKRRIIRAEFIQLLSQKLKQNGYIHIATDWEEYAFWILDMLKCNADLYNQSIEDSFIERPSNRPLTKFEQRGLNLGHKVWDIIFIKH